MDYDHDYTFSSMYFATEIRFDGIARLIKQISAKLARPIAGKATAARA